MTSAFRLLATTAIAFLPATAQALTITPTSDAAGLAGTLFLNTGGVSVTSTGIVSGSFGQFGTYQNAAGTYGLPVTGIVLSSGNVSDYGAGPNTSGSTTTGFGISATEEQEALLGPITGESIHFDVAQLSIDFFADAITHSVTFFATFGSEEWPEYVNSSVTDGFGLFVNGVNVAASGFLPINIDHPDMRAIPGTELDGILAPGGNPVLSFVVPVNAGQTNSFQIILADAGDAVLDTTIYLSSFFSEGGGVPDGASEFNPILPSNPPDPETGAFVIELPVDLEDGELVWIDPPIAVGYTYELNGNGSFASIVAPSLATVADLDGYTISIGGGVYALGAGATLDLMALGLNGVTSFALTGIDEALMLDPVNVAAFPLGISLVGVSGSVTITQTPITIDTSLPPVPLPAAGWMMLAGLGCLAQLRRRRRAHA